ncbi:MAG: hypothetical protein JNL08_04465 [Planctomycetes bacterium]|nr:hypothetical protein [Planctomycetota bacterium]
MGQRADLQLSADFTPASAVTWVSSHHEHTTEAGNILQPGLWDQYINIGSGFPWQDASSGSVNGSTAEGTTFIDKPTSSTNTTLTLLASAEVNSWQNVPPPPPYWSVGYYSGLARLEFTVSQPTTLTLDVTASGEVRGESQHFPVLPIVPPNGFSGGSGWWYDPPLALGFDFQMAGGSLFTDILTLPVGIDGDGMFEVEVGNQSLGQFAEGTRVDFRQILGGNGVPAFRIVGIDPAVDSTDAMVFPVQLAFDTPTADFTMTPVLWRKVGTTCADVALCPQCPALELAPVGQAIEGNLNFAIGVDHGPANGIAAFFVGLGSASPAPLPLFCGSVVLPLQNAVVDIGATALTGSAACDGSGSVPLPLVPVPSLLGAFLTVQAITICPAGGLGLTHGIEFAVGS